jgi:hypothetical protein
MDHFKNFRGFGEGYLAHHRETPVETLRRVLKMHEGKQVQLEYEAISTEIVSVGDRLKYAAVKFTPCIDRFKVPSNGAIEKMLEGVNTDKITIRLPHQTFELQKIVIGKQFITQLSYVD